MNYAELVALTDGLAKDLVPMPTAAPDVCPHCHTSRDVALDLCRSCGTVRRQFGHPCPIVLPISFYMTPAADQPQSPLRERMHNYKEHADIAVREVAAAEVGGILARYLVEHGEPLRERLGGWDDQVVVPSKKHGGEPALALALAPYVDLIGPLSALLRAGPGIIGRSSPNASGFEVTRPVEGRRILLMDDTFTTGATLHSAAHALVAAGATVAAGVVIARKINPDARWANSLQVWQRQSASPFSFVLDQYWSTEI